MASKNKIQNITEVGPQSYRDLQKANREAFEQASQVSPFANLQRPAFKSYQDYVYEGGERASLQSEDDSWGSSTYDNTYANEEEYANLSDVRAANQSNFSKVINGIGKGVGIAATTFLDGIVGTLTGAANIITKSIQGDIDDAGDILTAFIDNPFSQVMTQINDEMERVLPNYYSTAEQNAPWYTQLGTANFWGDKFLKNLGFAIGAAYSGKVITGGIAKKIGLKQVRDAFKGTVTTESGRVLNTAKEIEKAYRTGDAFMDGVKLTEDLGKAAKRIKNAELGLKITGSVTGAIGESRIEALNGIKEYDELHRNYIEDAYKEDIDVLNSRLVELFPDQYTVQQDENGNTVLTPNNMQAAEFLSRSKADIDNRREQALAKMDEDKGKIMNRVFAANMGLLTASNLWTLGRFFTGGYSAGRNAKQLLKGTFKDWIADGKAVVNKNAARGQLLKGFSNVPVEASEEMSQAMIQESVGQKYASELNNFYERQIDPDAEEQTIDWMNAIYKGFQGTYGDLNSWEEGFIGGLTGLIGIPSISFSRNENGKRSFKARLNSELWEGIKDYRNTNKEANQLASEINKRIQTPEFLNYYRGAIGHQVFDEEKQRSLSVGDRFKFKNADHSQFINDIRMFDKAGRLQDFLDLIDEQGTVTQEDVESIRNLSTNPETGKSTFESMTDQQIIDYFNKEKEELKKKANQYIEIQNNLKTLYGENISNDVLDELTWRMTTITELEDRGKQLMGDLKGVVAEKFIELNDKEVNTDSILVALNQLFDAQSYNQFAELFNEDTNLIDDINSIIEDNTITIEEQKKRISDRIKQTEQDLKNTTLEFGRQIRSNNIAFKKNTERLQKSKEKAINNYIKTQENYDRINQVRLDETEDFQDYMLQREQLIEDLERQIGYAATMIQKLGNKHKSRTKILVDNLTRELDELKNAKIEQANDELTLKEIDDTFTDRLRQIQTNLMALEGIANSDAIIDKRTKTGMIESNKTQNERARIEYENRKSALKSQIVQLVDMLDSKNKDLIQQIDVKEASDKLIDLFKVMAYRTRFIDLYTQLAANPEQFDAQIQESINKAKEKSENKQADKIIKSLGNQIKNPKDLKTALSKVDLSVSKKVLNKLKESEDEDTKKIAKRYDKLLDEEQKIADIINQRNPTPEVISATNIINDAIENATSIKEMESIIADSVAELPKEVVDEINDILGKVRKNKHSESMVSEDTNEPKKPVKKGRPSLLDNDAFTEEEADESQRREKESEEDNTEDSEENSEEEYKPSKPKRRKREASLVNDNQIEENETEDSINSQDSEDDNTTEDDKSSTTTQPINTQTSEEKPKENVEESKHNKVRDFIVDHEEQIIGDLIDNDFKGTVGEVIEQYIKLAKSKNRNSLANYLTLISSYDDTKALFEKLLNHARDLIEDDELPSITEDSDGSITDKNIDEEEPQTVKGNLRSWVVTQYHFDFLKDKNSRKAVEYNSTLLEPLKKLGAFEFVDNGSLGRLFNRNEDLPIHFIITNNDEFANRNVVLLAIEVTPETERISPALNKITAQDGKQYQVVGTMGFDKNDSSAQNNAANIYNSLIDELGDLEGRYLVSKKTTKIAHFYSGRMVKSSKEDPHVKQRPLREVLNGETPHFGIYYNSPVPKTPTLDSDEPIVPLNVNNTNPREGSLWLMTREADGRWYPKSVKIKRFTDDEYDLDEHMDTPIVKQLIEELTILSDPTKSKYDRLVARDTIEDLLYFPDEFTLLFNDDVVSIVGLRNNIGEGLSPEEKAMELLYALQDERLSLRFQIRPRNLERKQYVDDLLASDILTTDLLIPHNVNASFDIYPIDREGNIINQDKDVEKTGHIGNSKVNNSVTAETVYLNGVEYKIRGNDIQSINQESDIDDDLITAIKFAAQIKRGEVQPYKGSSLYIGTYGDGTTFGIVNGKIVSDEKMQEIIEQADKPKPIKKSDIASLFKFEDSSTSDSDFLFENYGEDTEEDSQDYEDSEDDIEEDVDEDNSTIKFDNADSSDSDFLSENYGDDVNEESDESDDFLEEVLNEYEKPTKKVKLPTSSDTNAETTTKTMDDTLRESIEKAEQLRQQGTTFNSLALSPKGIEDMRSLGFKNIKSLKEFIEDEANDLPPIETINTQEAWDSLIETIKNCR